MLPLLAALGPVMAQQPFTKPVRPLEEIVVTSSLIEMPRRRIGTAISVVSAEEIGLRGYNSLADLLRTQPGVGISNSGGPGKTTALRIRGEEGYRTMLVIDGVKAVDPTGPQVAPGFSTLLSTTDMERVEILRGPQGFVYGADAGGVVNVVTRQGGGTLDARIGLESGAYGTRRFDASLAGGSESADFYISVSDFATDGFNARTIDDVLMDADGADNETLHARFGWDVSENLRLQLVARDIDAEAKFDGCFLPVTFAMSHDCVETTNQTTARLAADWSTGALTHRFAVSDFDIRRDTRAAGASTLQAEGELRRIEYTGRRAVGNSVTLIYGLDLQSEANHSGSRVHRRQDGYYFEYQGAFEDRFFLSAGLRRDDNDDFGSHTSGRLSAAYVQSLRNGDSLKYRASLGTGFRAPSLFEAAYNSGPFAFAPAAGVALTEESSSGIDFGIEYLTASGLQLELTWFDQRIEDEIFFDLAGFSGYLQSAGESKSTGFEFATRAPLGERFEILGNWTRNRARDTTNAQRLRRPETLANLGLLYLPRGERLRLVANYRVSRDAVDIGDAPLDDYGVLDVSVAFRLNDTLEINGRIENAGDESYEEIVGFNTAGRSAYVGVRLAF